MGTSLETKFIVTWCGQWRPLNNWLIGVTQHTLFFVMNIQTPNFTELWMLFEKWFKTNLTHCFGKKWKVSQCTYPYYPNQSFIFRPFMWPCTTKPLKVGQYKFEFQAKSVCRGSTNPTSPKSTSECHNYGYKQYMCIIQV